MGQTAPPSPSPAAEAPAPAVLDAASSPHILLLDDVARGPRTTPEFPVVRYVRSRHVPDSSLSHLYATCHANAWLTPLVGEDKAARVNDG